MINGYDILLDKYPEFDEESRTPNGIDLRLGKVYELNPNGFSGLKDGEKFLPERKEVEMTDGGWYFKRLKPYILEVDRPITIGDDSMQVYKPRSTLLRSGSALLTACGDSNYNGHLAFLFITFAEQGYFIGKGERFAQMVDIQVEGSSIKYDGDYQEPME